MRLFDRIEKLQRMDALIRHKATGPPSSFARKLHISDRTLYNYLEVFRAAGCTLHYNKFKETYEYLAENEGGN